MHLAHIFNLCSQAQLHSKESAIFARVFDSHNVYYEKTAPPGANAAQGGWGEFCRVMGCKGQQRHTSIMHARRCGCKRAHFYAVASRYNAMFFICSNELSAVARRYNTKALARHSHLHKTADRAWGGCAVLVRQSCQ
jgi:hypothetical protein